MKDLDFPSFVKASFFHFGDFLEKLNFTKKSHDVASRVIVSIVTKILNLPVDLEIEYIAKRCNLMGLKAIFEKISRKKIHISYQKYTEKFKGQFSRNYNFITV